MNKKFWLSVLIIGLCSIMFLSGCTKKTGKENENDDKVHLKMLIAVDEEVFKNRFKDQISEAFPDINLELMEGNPADINGLQELFAKGDVPDIITVAPSAEYVEDLDLLMPIDELIEKHKFDLGIFREGIVDDLRTYDPTGEGHLYGLPLEVGMTAMYYNKDIFDKFGEDYPTDGMTWDEVVDLARKLTDEREGIQYKGMQILNWATNIPYRQLSIPGTDPETGEVLFADAPLTKQYFDLLASIRDIPGMQEKDEDNPDGFHENKQNIAMWIANATHLPLIAPVDGFQFDMVTTPVWKELPNIGPSAVALSFNITKHSKHPDEAFKVMAHLASPEGQKVLSYVGSPPTIEDTTIFDEFGGQILDQYESDYNARAPFTQKLAPVPPYSKYDEPLNGFMNGKANEFLESNEDSVTFIRKLKDEYETIVKEMQGKE
ncbi:ABC transporter substrate-binding protein [Bacillus sp. SD088]|uniref:ABC transporter substrate-binding protein n=1 Tax=Bacillus sp. SD088 TaxID=2782012 RepID=UPI001A9663F4|nr:extracellular solute-binding protein [Bacillus sp. SD088]MBO0993297.1 extracellular solute-binding protein [Bacillus sp. SD088]